jgi:mannose-6-phosphate isomerase-like protein (cupin superfamily)
MPIVLKGACRVMELREGEPRREGPLSVWRHVGRDSGAVAMSLRVLECDTGTSPGLLNPKSEEVLYVLEGDGTIFVDGWPYPVAPGAGALVPPETCLTLVNPGQRPLVLVSVQCPDPGGSLRLEPPRTRPKAGAAPPPRPPVRRMEGQAAQRAGDRWYRVLIDEGAGSREVTEFVGGIPPGRAPDHYHEYEEVLCVIAGCGRMWAEDASAPLGVGSLVFLPRRQVHCTENLGPHELRLVGVFHPSGSPAIAYPPH